MFASKKYRPRMKNTVNPQQKATFLRLQEYYIQFSCDLLTAKFMQVCSLLSHSCWIWLWYIQFPGHYLNTVAFHHGSSLTAVSALCLHASIIALAICIKFHVFQKFNYISHICNSQRAFSQTLKCLVFMQY